MTEVTNEPYSIYYDTPQSVFYMYVPSGHYLLSNLFNNEPASSLAGQ